MNASEPKFVAGAIGETFSLVGTSLVHMFHVPPVYLFCRACSGNSLRGSVISTITLYGHAISRIEERVIYAKYERWVRNWPTSAGLPLAS